MCQLKETGVKVLCTSRVHLTDLAARLNTKTILSIEAQNQDVRNYCEVVLSRKYKEGPKNKIIDRVSGSAKGKWVSYLKCLTLVFSWRNFSWIML